MRWDISCPCKLGKTVVDQGLVEHDTHTLQIVPSVASHASASFHLKDAKALHNLMVMELSELVSVYNKVTIWSSPSALNSVKIFVLFDDNSRVNYVSDFVKEALGLSGHILRALLLICDLRIKGFRRSLLNGCISILVFLLFGGD